MTDCSWQPTEDRIGNLASIKRLTKIKKTALRRRVWFKTLARIERGIIDLTVKYVSNVKSTILAKVLTAIVDKLQTAMESRLDCLGRTVGFHIAKQISELAIKWGNRSAELWSIDLMFAKFLAIHFGNFGDR